MQTFEAARPHPALADEEDKILKIHIYLADSSHFQREAIAGLRLLDLLRVYGFPVKAECGGACVCGTCHIRVPERWQHVLPQRTDEELAKLDDIPTANEASRLACQIETTDVMDGLELELQPDSLVAQTYWAAR
jgi:ferredoxin, 2Fe-2S